MLLLLLYSAQIERKVVPQMVRTMMHRHKHVISLAVLNIISSSLFLFVCLSLLVVYFVIVVFS